MGRSSGMKNWILIIAVGCLLTVTSTESANADGCWGSSRGGWGSGGSMGGGSYGCRGGLLSNAPVRNLLSRVGVGVGNGISLVGDGIANIFDRQPLRSALFGCRGGGSGGWGSRGSYGSTGCTGGWGSNGSGWGSNGGYAAAAPMPSSEWSLPSYVSAPVASYDSGSIVNLPIVPTNTYDNFASVPAYVDPVISSSGISTTQFETSAPVLDYGYYGSQFGTIGMPTDATMIGGSMITGPMMEVQGESANGVIVSPDSDDLPGYYDGKSTEPTPEDAFGAEEDDDDSAYLIRGKAILSLDVPKDAKVFINDKLTQTSGTRRSYVSRNLVRGQEYRYRVKVVSESNGKEVVKSRVVKMRGGESHSSPCRLRPSRKI